ncbi:MAG: hypothetical protein KGL95_10585, partial [Patescibacteria group bacterium]|nr:hypothetical protein [Patescibacteria group bacterium]
MAVNAPRDWHRIRDRLFSIFYNFITRSGTAGIVCLTGLTSITSYFLTGSINDGILSAIVIYTLIVFIKVFYFYDLPKGWSYTQWRNWLRQGGSNDVISRHRKQIVIGLCVLIIMGFLNGLIKPNS